MLVFENKKKITEDDDENGTNMTMMSSI